LTTSGIVLALNRDYGAKEQDRAVPRSRPASIYLGRIPRLTGIPGEDLGRAEPQLPKCNTLHPQIQFGLGGVDGSGDVRSLTATNANCRYYRSCETSFSVTQWGEEDDFND
jgi:hypothetical protein